MSSLSPSPNPPLLAAVAAAIAFFALRTKAVAAQLNAQRVKLSCHNLVEERALPLRVPLALPGGREADAALEPGRRHRVEPRALGHVPVSPRMDTSPWGWSVKLHAVELLTLLMPQVALPPHLYQPFVPYTLAGPAKQAPAVILHSPLSLPFFFPFPSFLLHCRRAFFLFLPSSSFSLHCRNDCRGECAVRGVVSSAARRPPRHIAAASGNGRGGAGSERRGGVDWEPTTPSGEGAAGAAAAAATATVPGDGRAQRARRTGAGPQRAEGGQLAQVGLRDDAPGGVVRVRDADDLGVRLHQRLQLGDVRLVHGT
eukprot:gene11545-biopygen3836